MSSHQDVSANGGRTSGDDNGLESAGGQASGSAIHSPFTTPSTRKRLASPSIYSETDDIYDDGMNMTDGKRPRLALQRPLSAVEDVATLAPLSVPVRMAPTSNHFPHLYTPGYQSAAASPAWSVHSAPAETSVAMDYAAMNAVLKSAHLGRVHRHPNEYVRIDSGSAKVESENDGSMETSAAQHVPVLQSVRISTRAHPSDLNPTYAP